MRISSCTSQFAHKIHQQSNLFVKSLHTEDSSHLIHDMPHDTESRCVSQLQSAANLFSHAVANPVQGTLLCFFYMVCTHIKAKGNYTF